MRNFMESRVYSTGLLSRPIVLYVVGLMIMMIGALNALPHMQEAVWQDEAVTLLYYSTHGIAFPFLTYNTPNSHIAFSSMLAGWITLFPDGVSVLTLRLLPFLLFLTAIPAMFLAGLRLGGPACAILGSLMFASSTVAGNFATQLRGYGPSWLFITLMFLCAMNVLGQRRWAWRALYLVCCFLSAAILPTNFFLIFSVAVAVSVYLALAPERRPNHARAAYVVLLLGPALGLLVAYAAVWPELLRYSSLALSPWTRLGLMQNWLHATVSDFIWAAPLIGAGILVGLQQQLKAGVAVGKIVSREFVLAILLALGLVAAILAMPSAPFPRTLVPFLPIWFCVLSYVVVYGVTQIIQRKNLIGFGCGLVLFALPVIAGPAPQSCKATSAVHGPSDYDLCYQYFRDQYHPTLVVDVWASLGKPDIPIVTSYEGYYALVALGAEVDVFEYRRYVRSNGPKPLIVAHDPSEFESIAMQAKLDASTYAIIADTGYFKVFAPIR